MPLRIKDWDSNFETNETRKLKRLLWVKFPNQHDSLPFKLVSRHPRGAEIFTAWVLMVQVASKKDKDQRGNLPESPDELGIITGFPGEIFELAIEFLKSNKIKWLEESPGTPGENPEASGNPPGNLPLEEGRNGREYIPSGATGKFHGGSEEVRAIFEAYPSHRTIRGKTTSVGKTLADYDGIAHVLNTKPEYPLLAVVRKYAKDTEAAQDLRTFLKALPDPSMLTATKKETPSQGPSMPWADEVNN